MVEINNFPNNQDVYRGAEDVMRWLYGRTSGVFGADGNAAVSAFDAPRMAVQVSDGIGWLTAKAGIGCVWWIDTAAATGSTLKLAVSAADAVYNRIDRVIVEWSTPNYTDTPVVRILEGTFSSNPTAPNLTNDSTIRQISLARISIKAGATEINAADITDERLDKSVCGIVTDRVEVDTSMIQSQMSGILEEMQSKTSALLRAIESQLASLEAGTAVELKKLLFPDVTVMVSSFVQDNTYQDYGYRAAVTLEGVIASMIPDVVFGAADAIGGNYCPVSETFDGGVYIYAASPPENDLTIPTIICWRGA